MNGKCIEDSGRSRLGGKRVLGCDNKLESLFVQKGYNFGGTCLWSEGNFDGWSDVAFNCPSISALSQLDGNNIVLKLSKRRICSLHL